MCSLIFFHLFLSSLIYLTSGQLSRSNTLTTEQFESAFTDINPELILNTPQIGQLFTRSNDTTNRELVPEPNCILNLIEFGKGLVDELCIEALKRQPLIDKKLPNYLVAYRCYFSDNLYDYELHTASVDRFQETPPNLITKTLRMIFFEPQPATDCTVKWLFPEAVPKELDYFVQIQNVPLQDKTHDQHLNKEQFEAAFGKLKDDFQRSPAFGYIFTHDLRTVDRQIARVQQCFVVLNALDKGLIHSDCADLIKEYQQINPKMPNLFFAYRCFKLNNDDNHPEDYHIITTKIVQVGVSFGNWVIYFPQYKTDECQVKPDKVVDASKYLAELKIKFYNKSDSGDPESRSDTDDELDEYYHEEL